MKKIAYIELDTHAEIARNFMVLMNESKEFVVDYYFSEKIFKQIGKHQTNIFLTESTELLNQLNLKKYDLIIIGTVHRYFNLFNEIATTYNTSVIVHNINFTKISRFQLFKNIFKKHFKYRLKLLLKEDLLSAPKIFKKAKNLLVLDESFSQKNLKYLPLFFNQYQENKPAEIYTIVIPGAVSQARRDYKKVLAELKNFSHNHATYEQPIQVIFLGKVQGKELLWLKDFEKELSNAISIQYFTEKVSQNIFDQWMNKADVLWCPIQRSTEFFSHPEIYSRTKMSGNIGDAIKYGKVAFFPKRNPSKLPFIMNEESFEKILHVQTLNLMNFQKEFNQKKIAADLEETLKMLLLEFKI